MARKTSRKIQEDAKFQVAQKNYQKFLGFIFVSFLLAYLIIIVRIHRDGFSETLVKIVGDPNLSDLYYTIAQSNFDNPWSRQIYELSANTYLPFPFILFNVLKLNYGTGSFIPTITDSLLIWIPLIIIAQTLVFILVKKRNRSPFVYGIAVLSSVLGLPMLQTTLRGNIQFIVFLMCVIYYAIVGNRGIHSIMRICIVVAIVTTKPQYLLVVLPGLFLYKNRIKEFIVSALISPVTWLCVICREPQGEV
jgi:hypothetical protein